MAPELTGEAWAQIRYDYEHTDRPLGDICGEHGISTGTLRDRVRRWGWTRRRLPIPFEGPPPAPPVDVAPFTAAAPAAAASIDCADVQPPPQPFQGEGGRPSWRATCDSPAVPAAPTAGEPNNGAIVPRLQGAVARVLPAIEATVARLAAGPTHPREIERAGRALAALTRTLRELSGLLERHRANICSNCGATPRSVEELRESLARKLEALVAGQNAKEGEAIAEADGGAEPPPEG